jgi:hypothetical protein
MLIDILRAIMMIWPAFALVGDVLRFKMVENAKKNPPPSALAAGRPGTGNLRPL